KFRDLEFYKANPVFEMDTVYEKSQYKVLAIFTSNTEPSQGEVFDYYNSLSFLTEEGFDEFVGEITSRSLIDTPVDAQYGDTLVTLSTCLYDYDGQRL
ncbi:class B sortase, partial [Bittarella massiliensis (ex Durand et al. 2017)]